MHNESESRKAWLRFRRNTAAFVSLWFIAGSVFIALFAYVLAPDNTTDANTHIPEIALKPAGFNVHLIGLPLEQSAKEQAWYEVLLHGRNTRFRWMPYQAGTYASGADSIQFNNLDGQVRRISAAHVSLSSRSFPLGTDKYGRCNLSRLILGFRVSLTVGFIAVFISLTIGLALGTSSGYFGGRWDDLVTLAINTTWSIPTLLLIFAVVLALGRSVEVIFLAVGLTMWVDVARVVRGQALALREMPFIEAAQSMGLRAGRIVWRHVLPNLLGPVAVVCAGNFATAILLESGLSYLGFGVQPPQASWGSMLSENYGYALSGNVTPALGPALAIVLTVLAFNMIGNGLRDALDTRSGG